MVALITTSGGGAPDATALSLAGAALRLPPAVLAVVWVIRQPVGLQLFLPYGKIVAVEVGAADGVEAPGGKEGEPGAVAYVAEDV